MRACMRVCVRSCVFHAFTGISVRSRAFTCVRAFACVRCVRCVCVCLRSCAQVLKGISFTLNKGEKIALVGKTGSGKSTILRLLTKTYDNYQGSITLNGVELSTIPKPIVRNFFSLMQQPPKRHRCACAVRGARCAVCGVRWGEVHKGVPLP